MDHTASDIVYESSKRDSAEESSFKLQSRYFFPDLLNQNLQKHLEPYKQAA